MKYAFSSVLLSLVLVAGVSPAAAATEPLDLRQSYSGVSDVAVSHIQTLNTYANGLGTTGSFSIEAGAFSFDDPFLKSSANPPLLTYFLGVSTDAIGATFRAASVESRHLVLAVTSSYAAGLVSGGQDFSDIFPTFDEDRLIDDLILVDGSSLHEGDPGFAAQQAAGSELVDFGLEINSRGGLTPAFGGPLTLLSFSSATPVGTGTADLTPVPVAGAVPEPAAWGLMLLGFGAVGAAARRAPRKTRAVC